LGAPNQRTDQWATEGCNETDVRLYESIPDAVDHVPHPEYLCPAAEKQLFGPDAPTIPVPQWRPSLDFQDAQEEVELPELPQAKRQLSRQDEALLFRRYNCARYHLAGLMEKQTRRFARARVHKILAWYRRALENRSALTQANMALVVAMARRTRANTVEFGELVSEGNMALLRAVDKFDFSRGFKFSTYACSAILKAFSRVASQAGTYRQRFPVSFEPDMERSDELGRRHADQRDLAIEDIRRELTLNRANLTDVEQTVVGARFAVAGHGRAHTLGEVGEIVRLSRERVRQVQNGALVKLRQALELTRSPVTPESGKTNGAFDNLATIPGRLGLGVLAAAGQAR
jgi:RNA polymerase sigma factor (sigma-70 family)